MLSPRVRGVLTSVGLFASVIMLTGSIQPLKAQLGMATLSGAVTDSTGGAIPNAQVTLRSSTEQAVHRMTADASGAYFFSAIVPGAYELVVTAGGFETRTITGINLSSGQGSTLNVTLSVGKATTQVNVSEVSPLLETTNPTVGAEVTSSQFVDLPMLGRNFTSLIDILPGVANIPSVDAFYSPAGVNGAVVAPAIFGQRQRDSYYGLDNAPNQDPINTTVGIQPPPEAIAEMKVESGMATGAFGWAAGANINVVTKSGSNKVHGDVWEFVRNNDLNARNFFSPSVGPFKWNQFGGALGGPLVIPHLISRSKGWYLFGYYEGVRIRESTNTAALVPTAAELNGDFSADPPIYNPFTTVVDASGNITSRQQFPGNMIPTGTTPLCAPQPTCINPLTLAIAKAFYPLPNLAPGVIPGANFFSSAVHAETSNQFSGRVDHQFRPQDSVYGRYSFWNDPSQTPDITGTFPRLIETRYESLVASETHLFSPTFLVTSRFTLFRYKTHSNIGGPDELAKTGFNTTYPEWTGGNWYPSMTIPGYETGIATAPGNYPNQTGPEYYSMWTADVQKVAGRHTVALGGSYVRTQFYENMDCGYVAFGNQQTALGANTGDSLASFLLGIPTSGSREGGNTFEHSEFNAYNWYVQDTFRATSKLTLNLGLRWDFLSPDHDTPGFGTFVWDTGQFVWDHKNPVTGAPANISDGLVPPDYRGYQPRVGLAYQINPKTVFRSSFGIFDDLYGANQQGVRGVLGNWPFEFSQSVTGVNTGVPTAFIQNLFPGPAVPSATPLLGDQDENTDYGTTRNGYVEEWSASVQRQISPSTLFEVDYFGSRGVKLWGQVLENEGVQPGVTPLATRQKYPGLSSYIDNNYAGNLSTYHGLAVKLQKHYSHGLMFLVDYTYSHAIDTADSLADGGTWGQPYEMPNRYQFAKFKSSAGYDIRHILSASYSYDLPAKSSNKFLNGVIGNWQTSGIVSADSGVPYFVFLSTDNENDGPIVTSEFPNFTCNASKGWNPTPAEWLNTSCFNLPTYGTLGNGDRHAYYSDHLLNWNSSIIKKWPVGEGKHLEFRGEFFNFTNSRTFDPPGMLFPSATFGSVSSTTRQPGRNIQFALKFHF